MSLKKDLVTHLKSRPDYKRIDAYIDKRMKTMTVRFNFPPIKVPAGKNNFTSTYQTKYFDKIGFQKFENLLSKVKSRYPGGRYQDTITQAKEKNRKLKRIVATYQPTSYINNDQNDSDDEELHHKQFLEKLIFDAKKVEYNTVYYTTVGFFKFLKICNSSASLLILSLINYMDLTNKTILNAIEDAKGLKCLVNIMESKDTRAQIVVLKVMKKFCSIHQYCEKLLDLGCVPLLIRILKSPSLDVKAIASDILSNLAVLNIARVHIRDYGGIPLLIYLMDIEPDKITEAHTNRLTIRGKVAQSAATVIWAASKCKGNRILMREIGLFPLLNRLLKSGNPYMLVPIIGILQHCSNEQYYKASIRYEDMLNLIFNHLNSNNLELKIQCALTLFSCSEDSQCQRDIVLQNDINLVVTLLNKETDLYLIYGLTGLIWKCCRIQENAIVLENMNISKILIGKLKSMPSDFENCLATAYSASKRLKELDNLLCIAVNITGALSELSKVAACRSTIVKENGIEVLIKIISGSNLWLLLLNSIRTLENCAETDTGTQEIVKLGGVRCLFSYLKQDNDRIKAAAAWALAPCLRNSQDCGEMVRNFVGALELFVDLLRSNDEEVLCATCLCLSIICDDSINLEVVSDLYGVQLLQRLFLTSNSLLMFYVTIATSVIGRLDKNSIQFGQSGVVDKITKYLLATKTQKETDSAVSALYCLSKNAENCMEMHTLGLPTIVLNKLKENKLSITEDMSGLLENIRNIMACVSTN